MKRLLFAFIAMLFFVSCSSENDDPEYPDKPNTGTDDFSGYTPNDTIGFNKSTINSFNIGVDIVGFTALKNDEVWIGLFDRYSKEELQTWSGQKPVHHIEKLYPYDAHITENGYAFSVSINGVASEHTITTRGLIILNKNQTNIICLDLNEEAKKIQILSNGIWYKYYKSTSYAGYETNGKMFAFDGTVSKKSLVNTLHESEYYHFTDSMLLAGFDDKDKIWFGLYTKTGDLLKEWTASTPTIRDVEVHLGYGEYEKFHLSTLYTSELLETPWGYAANIYYKDNETDSYIRLNEILFLTDNEINKTALPLSASPKLYNWYNNSLLIKQMPLEGHYYYVYTSDGELILEKSSNNFYESLGDFFSYPVSYESYIHFSYNRSNNNYDLSLNKYTIGSNHRIWTSFLKSVPSDSKIDWNILEQVGNKLSQQVSILYYDGSREKINFVVDIESGKIEYL